MRHVATGPDPGVFLSLADSNTFKRRNQQEAGWYLRDNGFSFGVQNHAKGTHPEAADRVLRLHVSQESGF